MIEKLDRLLERIAFALLGASLFFMLALTLANIVARWFHATFTWIDPLVRHLVFLSAFMGGVLATGKGNHIKIDLAGRTLESLGKKHLQKIHGIFVGCLSALACFFLVKAGWDFTQIELQFGKRVFLGAHSGWLTAIIPIGFALIGARFVTVVLLKLREKN